MPDVDRDSENRFVETSSRYVTAPYRTIWNKINYDNDSLLITGNDWWYFY